MYSNPRGIRSKMHSLHAILKQKEPDILVLVESQLVGKNSISIKGYDRIIMRNRSGKGGGILVAARNQSNLQMITTEINANNEQMWLQISDKTWKFNLCVAYGLQESRSTKEEIDDWYYNIEKAYAENQDEPTLIIGDLNALVGNDEHGIKNNHPIINTNGEKLRSMTERRELTILNATDKCTGQWTRIDPNRNNSIIDLVIANEDMTNITKKIIVDEERNWALTRYRKINGVPTEITSDHNTIFVEVEVKKN